MIYRLLGRVIYRTLICKYDLFVFCSLLQIPFPCLYSLLGLRKCSVRHKETAESCDNADNVLKLHGPYTSMYRRVTCHSAYLNILPFTWDYERDLVKPLRGIPYRTYSTCLIVECALRGVDVFYTLLAWQTGLLPLRSRTLRLYMSMVHCWTILFRFLGFFYAQELIALINHILTLQSDDPGKNTLGGLLLI